MPSNDHSKQTYKHSVSREAINDPEHTRKESKAKRKLEVNIQPGKVKVYFV